MILEIATLNVIPGREEEFEQVFVEAQKIISSMSGYVSHELRRCVEHPSRYGLFVTWERIEDHTEGFRNSAEYQEWRALLHHFFEPPPQVEHYVLVADPG
ncbi:MAG: antibiotic biosynthesis monooxygenase [Gammaproteobacteria bacterium]|nr:antibiotic biosynthesis monooxygenase [Gammaproteobacteria bacterium]